MTTVYDQALAILGEAPVVCTKIYKYYGYKNGESKEFNTHKEALQFSELTEKVCVNLDQYKQSLQDNANYYKTLQNEMYSLLKENNPVPYFDEVYDRTVEQHIRYEDFQYQFDELMKFAAKVVEKVQI